MKILKSLFLTIALCLTQTAMAQTTTDHLKIGDKIHFAGTDYHLAWSSHPAPTFYIQEYVAKGDTVERYQRMIIVYYHAKNITPQQALSFFVDNLETRKQGDSLVDYRIIENNGEYLLDFMLSQRATDGTIEILERNVYRNIPQAKGLVQFAVSDRAYTETDINQMVKSFKDSSLAYQVSQMKKLEIK